MVEKVYGSSCSAWHKLPKGSISVGAPSPLVGLPTRWYWYEGCLLFQPRMKISLSPKEVDWSDCSRELRRTEGTLVGRGGRSADRGLGWRAGVKPKPATSNRPDRRILLLLLLLLLLLHINHHFLLHSIHYQSFFQKQMLSIAFPSPCPGIFLKLQQY